MRIAIANAKGGVGKTTIAQYLCHALVRDGQHVTLLDADPQYSATLWDRIANLSNETLPFNVRAASVDELAAIRATPGEWLVIDAPPTHAGLKTALDTADFVIVPTTESPVDLQQAWATVNAAGRTPAAVLLNRVETNTVAFRQAMHALETQDTPRFDTIVPKRQEIKTSFGHRPAKLWEYGLVLHELRRAVGR